jgi:hypothetical protein
MDTNGNDPSQDVVAAAPPASAPPAAPSRSNWPLVIVAGLLIIVPFILWYGTWFGRPLSDDEIARYLSEENNPRHVQHALARIEERIEKSDPSTHRFYPQISALAHSPVGEVRKTVAWVMGQDNKSEEFHRALVSLLDDSEPLVRRNAALQLVRFGDASGRKELVAMLQPFAVAAPYAGTIVSVLPEGSVVEAGSLLARIQDASGAREFRSPLNGLIKKVEIAEGNEIKEGQTLLWLTPDRATLRDGLQALAYVGDREDLEEVNKYASGARPSDADTRQRAITTAKAIETRNQSPQ